MSLNKTYSIYKSDLGEMVPKVFLERLFGLSLEKIKKQKGKRTPDYAIKDADGAIVATCEVKTLIDSFDNFDSILSFEELEKLSKKRDRNHRSKLRRGLSEALDQLRNYSGKATFVIFVSFDMTDCIDLDMVLNDKETFPSAYQSDGYILIKAHQKLTPSKEFEIRETACIRFNPGRGEVFSQKYLSTEEAIRKGGKLPLAFELID